MRTVRITVVAILALLLSSAMFAGTASAGETDYPAVPKDNQVLDNTVTNPPAKPAATVLDSSVSLPVTGGDVVGLTLLGVAFVGVGVAFTTYRRRAEA